MKKSLILIISILAMAMTSAAYAGVYNNGTGGNVTIGTTSDTGGTLVAEISPGVLVSVATTVNTYGVVTVNTKAGADAIGYNVHSSSGAVFLKNYDTAPTTVDAAKAGSLATTDYKSK